MTPEQPQSEPPPANDMDAALAALEDEQPRGGLLSSLGRLTGTQLLLIVNTGAVALLAFGVVWLSSRPTPVLSPIQRAVAMTVQPGDSREEQLTVSVSAPTAAELAAAVGLPVDQAVSWDCAQDAYRQGEYLAAYEQYSALAELAAADPAADLMRDFLRLRMAMCCQELRDTTQARVLLEQAAASKSPAVRAAATYRLAVLDERGGIYLDARMRAYQALGAMTAIQVRWDLADDCELLVARTLTRKALSYYGQDHAVPWSEARMDDPLAGLEEMELQSLLDRNAGIESEALLGPRIEQTALAGQVPLWTATCLRASVSDLLNIFAAEADLDLQWVLVSDAARGRAVTLHLPEVSSQRLCEIAAGSVGLVARFTGEKVIVHNPPALESTKDQRDVLLDEAISAWRRLFLRSGSQQRLAEGYFALGLLHECSGATIEAINDYQLTAKRFARSHVASRALLRSAGLLSELRDFGSARTELLELLDRYPECAESGDAYAALGEATHRAGRHGEAFAVFKKLFFLGLSPESRRLACLGAGRALHAEKRHDKAAEWLARYIALSAHRDATETSEAYFLLGGSYLAAGDGTRAVAAYHQAMATSADPAERVDAALAVARAYQQAGELSRALGALQAAAELKLSDEQAFRMRLLTAGVYRRMGLADRAATYLRGTMGETGDVIHRARLAVELGRCYGDLEQYRDAAEVIAEALGAIGAGDEARQAACDLAEMYLKIDRPAQAITLSEEVLASASAGAIAQRARRILADARLACEEYEQAAIALAGLEPVGAGGPSE